MTAGLFPATFNNSKTAFTFRVLEDFHLENLECKTTPSQFFSCLRRLTNDKFPNTVLIWGLSVDPKRLTDWQTQDRYWELLRVCRQWRALISQKRFGFGYEENEGTKPGSMAVFCVLCAQPGINLPDDWREYENRYVNRHQDRIAAEKFLQQSPLHARFHDGQELPGRAHENEKFREWRPTLQWYRIHGQLHTIWVAFALSVWEAAGKLYLCNLCCRVLIPKKRSTCHDHCAVNNVNKHGGHLESTGIGATACIHGNFVPDSVVDFQKGEAWVLI